MLILKIFFCFKVSFKRTFPEGRTNSPGPHPGPDESVTSYLNIWHVIGQYRDFFTFKSKSVPLHAWSDPECSRNLRLPDCVTVAQDGGKVVSLTHRPLLPPGNTPGTHFC